MTTELAFTGTFFPGVKVSLQASDYLLPSSTEVKNECSGALLPSPHQIPSWHEPVLFIFTSDILFPLARFQCLVLWFGILTAMHGV